MARPKKSEAVKESPIEEVKPELPALKSAKEVMEIVQAARASGCRPDFSYKSLAGLNLGNLDLRASLFICSDLNGTQFEGANLQGSIFSGADTLDACFDDSNLEYAVGTDQGWQP